MRIPLAAITALTLVTAPVIAQRHPHFDDQGTLAWHTSIDAAKAAARAADKLILVEVGTKT
jgi:hypothetical protein